MSKLKTRSTVGAPWETIETKRTKFRFSPAWKWAAHRGVWPNSYENTIPSMIRAKEQGFDCCECDLQFTSDGVCVLCHNATISGKNESGETVTLTIAESAIEEIKSLILATVPRFGKIYAPTLDEFLAVASIIGIDVILHGGAVNTEEESKTVAKSVLMNGMQGRVVYMPATLEAGGWIADVDKHAAIEICFIDHSIIPEDLTPYTELLGKCDYVGVDLPANKPPTADDVARLRANGLGISFWNVGWNNYAACMDVRPRALTMVDNAGLPADFDKAYFDAVKLW